MESAASISVKRVYASSTAQVRVIPALIKDLDIGEEFTINVTIENVENLYGFEIKFSWNPSIIECISRQVKVPVETFPDGILHQPVQQVKDQLNNTAGTYSVAYSSMSPAPPFNGSGIIFTMTFRVIGYGTSPLSFTSIKLAGFGIPPPPIPFETYDGLFTNFTPPPAKLKTEPDKIIDPTLIPCKNFTIDVEIKNAYNLANFEFWFKYNTSVLDVLTANILTPFVPTINEIFEENGTIHLAGDSTEPLIGNFTLASIQFHVVALGDSLLDLYNVTLRDPFDQPLEYDEVKDGYFNNILLAKIFLHPSELIDPTMVIGSIFSIEVRIKDAIDFYGYQYFVNYDPNILICLGINILPPTQEVHYTPIMLINQSEGSIYVNVSYYLPAQPITVNETKTIGIILFQVKNYGSTLINLNNITIIDIEGRSIPHLEDGSEDCFFATLTVDVAILEITLSKSAVYPGKNVTANVVAGNVGDLPSSFNVTLYIGSSEIGIKEIINLPPNATITLTFTINTTGLQPCTNYTVRAVASKALYEIELSNNELNAYLKIKKIGDINGDGIVDVYDVTAACISYGSKVGDPNWNEEVDLAPEWGLIDIFDLVTITMNYGSQC
jgi:hypothetical protein